jgi:hypothetical protein
MEKINAVYLNIVISRGLLLLGVVIIDRYMKLCNDNNQILLYTRI